MIPVQKNIINVNDLILTEELQFNSFINVIEQVYGLSQEELVINFTRQVSQPTRLVGVGTSPDTNRPGNDTVGGNTSGNVTADTIVGPPQQNIIIPDTGGQVNVGTISLEQLGGSAGGTVILPG